MIQQQWQQYLDSAAPAEEAGPPGIAWLRDLAAVRFEGSNARDFLQGYLTSDTDRLADGAMIPTALCNLKGRVVVNGWCAPDGAGNVLLVLHDSLVSTLAAFLKPYLTFSRNTSLVDLRDGALVFGGLDLATAGGLELDERRRLFIVQSVDEARRLWEHQPHLAAETWLAALSADGIPLLSAPVSGEFLPQMLNLDTLGAVDFQKGCYLGQEVVARAQHRGQVKRRLARLMWQDGDAPEPGTEVTDASGRAQGVVIQSTPAAGRTQGLSLAVLRGDATGALRAGETLLKTVS